MPEFLVTSRETAVVVRKVCAKNFGEAEELVRGGLGEIVDGESLYGAEEYEIIAIKLANESESEYA